VIHIYIARNNDDNNNCKVIPIARESVTTIGLLSDTYLYYVGKW